MGVWGGGEVIVPILAAVVSGGTSQTYNSTGSNLSNAVSQVQCLWFVLVIARVRITNAHLGRVAEMLRKAELEHRIRKSMQKSKKLFKGTFALMFFKIIPLNYRKETN
jgi:hypothetical protein